MNEYTAIDETCDCYIAREATFYKVSLVVM